jgi:hypothetical protein
MLQLLQPMQDFKAKSAGLLLLADYEPTYRPKRLRRSSFDPAKYTTNAKDVKQDGDQRRGDHSAENALVD